jgi:hypothetical protein
MWTSSLECSNNKNSGVVVALARPTVTQEKLTMTFLQNVVGMCYMCHKKWPEASKQGTAKE